MHRRTLRLAAPALALALTVGGVACGDDDGNPTDTEDDGPDMGDPGSQTNSDEGRGEGDESQTSPPEPDRGDDSGGDAGTTESDGTDSGQDEGTESPGADPG